MPPAVALVLMGLGNLKLKLALGGSVSESLNLNFFKLNMQLPGPVQPLAGSTTASGTVTVPAGTAVSGSAVTASGRKVPLAVELTTAAPQPRGTAVSGSAVTASGRKVPVELTTAAPQAGTAAALPLAVALAV
ncbi:MAG: hypothetical protein P4L87_14845 [Formivibrio sp.]|nr:hypothetical protein [Formivibrio sp.]